MMHTSLFKKIALGAAVVGLLGACSQEPVRESTTLGSFASLGQVNSLNASSVSAYAAARFAEQASFGASPATVAAIQQMGFERWIDQQFALAVSEADVKPFLEYRDPQPPEEHRRYEAMFPDMAVGAQDQLRLRVAWALSQFIVVSDRTIDRVGVLYWFNMLQRNALGRYDQLLYDVSVSPAMGVYLNNNQNRPKSAECQHCAPNENFARELMQLFSLGVVKLTADGQSIRNPDGSFAESYTQRDVEEMARVLTGWQNDPSPNNRPQRNYANWGKPMIPSTWPPERDSGSKVVLGKVFPANQSQEKDLRDAIDLLMSHQNIAPFVAIRLIQHLVKSDPSPAYVARVASVFRNNGQSVRGDMKAVVKAVLLDAEARRGDDPKLAAATDGKIREPFLHFTAAWRGLGCERAPSNEWGLSLPGTQRPFNAESVFSFYAPTDRAPGSNLLAPEQRIVTTGELTQRLSLNSNLMRWSPDDPPAALSSFRASRCEIDKFVDAYASSPSDFAKILSDRFFRGAMPYALRYDIEQLIKRPQWNANSPEQGALRMIDYALSSPYFGVIR